MTELVKAAGGIGWIVGVLTLAHPDYRQYSLLILIGAFVATLWVRARTRDARHAELVKAAGNSAESQHSVQRTPSATERLAQLKALRDSGDISVEEYVTKRKDILDSI